MEIIWYSRLCFFSHSIMKDTRHPSCRVCGNDTDRVVAAMNIKSSRQEQMKEGDNRILDLKTSSFQRPTHHHSTWLIWSHTRWIDLGAFGYKSVHYRHTQFMLVCSVFMCMCVYGIHLHFRVIQHYKDYFERNSARSRMFATNDNSTGSRTRPCNAPTITMPRYIRK